VAAARAAFGAAVRRSITFARAKRILSIDADFLHASPAACTTPVVLRKGRKVTKKDDPMNRLYVAESGLTLTGSMADHRLRLASSHMLALAARLGGASVETASGGGAGAVSPTACRSMRSGLKPAWR
jgi:hypothetical protein